MSDSKTLYDTDFFAWSQQQAEAVRAAGRRSTNRLVDWENVAEEIESLGRSDRRELHSQIRRIIEHLLKLEHSPATEPREGWRTSLRDARVQIEVVLADSPSLRRLLPDIIQAEHRRGFKLAIGSLAEREELSPEHRNKLANTVYRQDQILGDWFPPEPGAPQG
jgi:hypothetical protein